MSQNSSLVSTSDLRKILLDTIDDVRQNRMTPDKANAITKLSGEILKSAKLDLDAAVIGHRISDLHNSPVLLAENSPQAPVLEDRSKASEVSPRPTQETTDMAHGEADTLLVHFLKDFPEGEQRLIKSMSCKTPRELAELGIGRIKKFTGAGSSLPNRLGKWLREKFQLELAD